MDNKLVYDRQVIEDERKLLPEHQQVLKWVGHNKKVLEVGCHTGYFSSALKSRNCEVVGIEIYEPALKKAEQYLVKGILGNIESEHVWNEVSAFKFDVILFMHVLEHLVAPETVLEKFKTLLNPGGIVVICLPNINNWVNRYEIAKGGFNYTEFGVMDKTHLKFYNYFSAKQFIESTGLKVFEYSGVSSKVRFKVMPDRWLMAINNVYNSIIHKILGPNITDKVIMYKAVQQS